MSDTDNREPAAAPQGEPIASSPIASDKPAQEAPAPVNRIAESAFEATHADLPPLSAIGGGDAPATTGAADTSAPAGPRRGRGRGAPAGKSANGQTAKVAFGVVENPADLTESLSGKHVAGYGDAAPAERPRREDRPRREERPRTEAPAPSAEGVAATPESGPKEFVPPVSQGTFKAELNPEAEQKAREERRQRDDRGPRENRGERGPRNDRPQGERRENRDGNRENRGERGPRNDRPQGERRENRENRGERNRPGRLTIEAPKIPVQEPTSLFGKIKRWVAETILGVPPGDEIEFNRVSKPRTPHSKDWEFNRGGRNPNNGGRRDFGRGNGGNGNGNRNGGGDRNPNRDGRHRPHARGGNHHDRGGRQG